MKAKINIFNDDCIGESNRLPDESVDLCVFDPPYGIKEKSFDKYYSRDPKFVINGYQEAPPAYEAWATAWLIEAKRILKKDGSIYIFIGHSSLRHVLNALHTVGGLHEINHLIWQHVFPPNTKKKFCTSHVHVLYYCKSPESSKSKRTFNRECRFGKDDKTAQGKSLLYQDLQSVTLSKKTYKKKEKKHQNTLPEEIISKLISYSSNEGDMICDFFQGGFTTAYVALGMGRNICGYEINKNSYDHHIGKVQAVEFGHKLKTLKVAGNTVPNISSDDEDCISISVDEFRELSNQAKLKDVEHEESRSIHEDEKPIDIKQFLDGYIKQSVCEILSDKKITYPIDENTHYVTAKQLSLYIPYSEDQIHEMAKNKILPFRKDINQLSGKQRRIFNLIEVQSIIEAGRIGGHYKHRKTKSINENQKAI